MKFAHRYKLLKAMPGHNAGEEVCWRGGTQRFYFSQKREHEHDLRRDDMDGLKFTVDQIQDADWFAPTGELVDFIPPFPSRTKIEEFIYLIPDCRLVDDVDECRVINQMLSNKSFQRCLYEFYKKEYEAFHSLNGGSQ